jgi:predicted MPP superfamily phosphohydrolase
MQGIGEAGVALDPAGTALIPPVNGTPVSGLPPIEAARPLADEAGEARLDERMGAIPAACRRAIEARDRNRRLRHPQTWTEVENWPGSRQLIRLLLSLVGLHGRAHRNARSIEVRENELEVVGLPPQFEGYTLLHLSDLHIDIAPDVPQVIAQAVRGHRYDACVMTGDYRAETRGPHEQTLAGLRSLMQSLNAPVYAVLGNHDSIAFLGPIETLGVRMLMNESVRIERGGAALYIAGVDDPHYFASDDLARARSGIPSGAASILLAHSPEIHERAAEAGFTTMLCGHTHGGQLCLPGGFALRSNAPCPRRLWAGAWTDGDLRGYTSVGCGTCVVDLRLNCRPEITLHRLRARLA